MNAAERMAPLGLNPEMASLDCGTLNFGDDIFVNDLPLMRTFATEMRQRFIVPELECFEGGHVANGLRLASEGLLPDRLHFGLVLGVPGALPATVKNLQFLVDQLPQGATWSAAGMGRHQLPMAFHAIAMGGHVRTGFEDNIYYRKGELARSNAQLVERIARLAAEADRPVASPEEAREILGIPRTEEKEIKQ